MISLLHLAAVSKIVEIIEYVMKTDILAEAVLPIVASLLIGAGVWAREWIRKLVHDRHIKPGKLREDMDRDKKIYAVLGGLLSELEGDRACIFLLHNGGNFSSGEIMRKSSCVYEAVEPGGSPDAGSPFEAHISELVYTPTEEFALSC